MPTEDGSDQGLEEYIAKADALKKRYGETHVFSVALAWLAAEERIRELRNCSSAEDYNVYAKFEADVPAGTKTCINIMKALADRAAYFSSERQEDAEQGDLFSLAHASHTPGHA